MALVMPFLDLELTQLFITNIKELVNCARRYLRPVCVTVGQEIGCQNVAIIGILPSSVEPPVIVEIVVIDGSVKHEENHLWNLFQAQVARYRGAIGRTKAPGKLTIVRITLFCPGDKVIITTYC